VLQFQTAFRYNVGVKEKPLETKPLTADAALRIAMKALVKIATEVDIIHCLVAAEALGEIGDPKRIIGVNDILGPTLRGRTSFLASAIDARVATIVKKASKE
jgi:hypothetical protein